MDRHFGDNKGNGVQMLSRLHVAAHLCVRRVLFTPTKLFSFNHEIRNMHWF